VTVTHCDNAGAAVFHCNPATNQVAGVSYDANGSQLNGGNLLSKSPSGGAPTLSQSVNTATNQIVGQSYDGNGNQTSSPLGTLAYDAENRAASMASAGVQYAYDSRNKRVWRSILSGGNLAQQVYVYGVDGQKIGTYTFTLGQYGETNTPEMTNSTVLLATFFGHKRVGVYDRLGSAKYNQSNNQAQSFYPYGEDRGTVEPNDALKFATYTRDAATGLDYADQRYYANNFGRFMSPDRYVASGGASDPGSWNRYSYTRSDPVNRVDPMGTCDETVSQFMPGTGPAIRPCVQPGPEDPGPDPEDPDTGEPGQPGGGSNFKSKFPLCNTSGSPTTEQEINFITQNYQAAASVASEADSMFTGLNAQNFNTADVLGWAAAESGYAPPSQSPDSGLSRGNLDYFNLTAGTNWINQVACPKVASSYWACFGSFQGAAEAALFSPTPSSYNGVLNAGAGYVLAQVLGGGGSLTAAFQAVATQLHFAQNPNYGADVQGAVNSVGPMLNCLQANYASLF
jgi:RHS repeat-associated protein